MKGNVASFAIPSLWRIQKEPLPTNPAGKVDKPLISAQVRAELQQQTREGRLIMDMASFQHITPPLRLFYGPDSLGSLGRELARLDSKRAVIFCGPWARGPLLDAVQAGMGDRCAGVFEGVVAHSPVASVEAAAQELKRLDADAVVALGGGSSIVTARAGKHPRRGERQLREAYAPRGTPKAS